ncbi:MAG: heavy metal-associated domain-containing protein [Candidatus Peribacteraceae bacterium]
MPSTTVSIPGMHCASCATLIQDVSADFSAIQRVETDLQKKIVTIAHDALFDFQAWKRAIEELGDAYKLVA